MEKHTNFVEMFADSDYVSHDERKEIVFQAERIGKKSKRQKCLKEYFRKISLKNRN